MLKHVLPLASLALLATAPAHAQDLDPADRDSLGDLDTDDASTATTWFSLESGGRCLVVDGSRIATDACSDANRQLWSQQGDHLVNGDGLCLASVKGRRGAGRMLRAESCADVASQRVTLDETGIVLGHDLCVEVDRRGRVSAQPCDGRAAQAWTDVQLAADEGHDCAPVAAPEPLPVAPAVLVQGPTQVFLPPTPSPVQQAFEVVHHSIDTFRSLVDLFAPGTFNSFR